MFYQTQTARKTPSANTVYNVLSMRMTQHFFVFLSLVTLTFDLDIQTRPSEGPNTSSL